MRIKENEIGAKLKWFSKEAIRVLGSATLKITSDILE